MAKARHVVAAMIVATALCADRVVTAAPRAPGRAPELVRRLAFRLTSNFRQSVQAVRVGHARIVPVTTSGAAFRMPAPTLLPPAAFLTPSQLPLPPPAR